MTVVCHKVTKQYRDVTAINNLTTTFKENSITGLIGRNGAGKTTLLQMIAGVTRPTSGEVEVFGVDPRDNLTVSANTIFVDDRMVFPAELNLKDILTSLKTFYKNWDQELALKLVDYFSLNLHQYHEQLSKGKRSTFNMIVGLASRCPLTILDEPTTGMDYSARQDFYRALLKDYINHPRTIIVSSHLLNEIEDILEQIVLIKNGELCLNESVDDLREYAVGLTGQKEMVEKWAHNLEIIARKEMSSNVFVAVKNDFSNEEVRELERSGINISAVSTVDLCTYLTSPAKGGIDDVFNENESI